MKNLCITVETLKILTVFSGIIHTILSRRVQYPEGGFFGNNYFNDEALESKINTALGMLDHSLQWMKDWPTPVQLGQVAGVALDKEGHVYVFHRATNVWDARTFSERNVYQSIGEPPIAQPTILVFNDTGYILDMWGRNLFYMPHGITVDNENNVWVTDVALHQVFKFSPEQQEKPVLVLGEKFIPGNDDQHFCKPSAVAVMSNGDFFVADGYCNHRILKFSAQGEIILQWGKSKGHDPFVLNVPHALALCEDRGAACVADREHGRAACFRADNGSYLASYSHELIGSRLFGVAYSPARGGRLYVVNGPYGSTPVPVRGYVIEVGSGRLVGTFAPPAGFRNPHAVAVSPDGRTVYAVELDPYRVHKFVDRSLDESPSAMGGSNATQPAKPTATVELSRQPAGTDADADSTADSEQAAGSAWLWAGGGGAAAAAALLAGAAAALLRARTRGHKSAPRRRWEYGRGEFKLRRLLERRRFTRVRADDSDEEPAPMLPRALPTTA